MEMVFFLFFVGFFLGLKYHIFCIFSKQTTMSKLIMKELLEESSSLFYTNLIEAACALLASVIGFLLRKRHIGLRLMFIYPFSSFLQFIIYFLIYYLQHIEPFIFLFTSTKVFLIIEFLCILIFYLSVLTKKKLRRITLGISILYSLFIAYHFIYKGISNEIPIQFYFFQSFIILFFPVIHLIDLFSDKPKPKLSDEPSFWITIGVLLYFLCVIPLYIGGRFVFGEKSITNEQGIYSINFICYSIFFLLITRAFLCKTPVKP